MARLAWARHQRQSMWPTTQEDRSIPLPTVTLAKLRLMSSINCNPASALRTNGDAFSSTRPTSFSPSARRIFATMPSRAYFSSLEYYAGILSLTTNRVEAMDPAFESRIQMSLFYPKLNLDVTTQLYEKFIKRAKAEQNRTGNHAFRVKEREVLKFAKRHYKTSQKKGYNTWNGSDDNDQDSDENETKKAKNSGKGKGPEQQASGQANDMEEFEKYQRFQKWKRCSPRSQAETSKNLSVSHNQV